MFCFVFISSKIFYHSNLCFVELHALVLVEFASSPAKVQVHTECLFSSRPGPKDQPHVQSNLHLTSGNMVSPGKNSTSTSNYTHLPQVEVNTYFTSKLAGPFSIALPHLLTNIDFVSKWPFITMQFKTVLSSTSKTYSSTKVRNGFHFSSEPLQLQYTYMNECLASAAQTTKLNAPPPPLKREKPNWHKMK